MSFGSGGGGMSLPIASWAGDIMSGYATTREAQAMADAYQAEIARQGAWQKQASALMPPQVALSGAQGAQQGLQQGAAQRMQSYGNISQTPLSVLPSQESGIGQARDAALYNLEGQNRANLGAYGDWMHNVGIGGQRTQQGLNQISNLSSGYAQNVFPLNMYQAQHSMDELAAWGQIVSSLGMLNAGSLPGGAGQQAPVYGSQQPLAGQMYPMQVNPYPAQQTYQYPQYPVGDINTDPYNTSGYITG